MKKDIVLAVAVLADLLRSADRRDVRLGGRRADPSSQGQVCEAEAGEKVTSLKVVVHKTRLMVAALLLAVPLAAQSPEDINTASQLRDAADRAGKTFLSFLVLSLEFDAEIQERRSPFNTAAAAKYCAEYTIRALLTPRMRREFETVAGNLAYDAVAEGADAAELAAEMAGMATDLETAEEAAALAQLYYGLAETFNTQVRPVDRKQAGQRMLRAMHAAERANRWVERLKARR